MRDCGSIFLALPGGEVLRHGGDEPWMLQYELDYWQQVQPAAPETVRRLTETLWEPLASLRSAPGGDLWWTRPEAADAWGKALAAENFIVLDDFLPFEAAAALQSAARSLKNQMSPGKTDSDLAAKGRGDQILELHC